MRRPLHMLLSNLDIVGIATDQKPPYRPYGYRLQSRLRPHHERRLQTQYPSTCPPSLSNPPNFSTFTDEPSDHSLRNSVSASGHDSQQVRTPHDHLSSLRLHRSWHHFFVSPPSHFKLHFVYPMICSRSCQTACQSFFNRLIVVSSLYSPPTFMSPCRSAWSACRCHTCPSPRLAPPERLSLHTDSRHVSWRLEDLWSSR